MLEIGYLLLVETIVSVSAIISTYTTKRLNDVLRCISSVKNQTFPPTEVILVLDPSEKLMEFFKSRIPLSIRIVMSDDVGLSNARNIGIKNARGTIVAFIDDDATADEKWLEKMIKNYEDPNVIGVGGLIRAVWKSERPIWFPEELDWIVGCSYKGFPKGASTIRNPLGCNMSFRKSVFEKVGYFRSDFGRSGRKLLSCEETEFSIRALRKIKNSKIVYDHLAVVNHRIDESRASLKYVLTRSFYEGVSKALIAFKSNSSTISSTEEPYLNYLVKSAVPSRLRRIYRFENLSQLIVLFLSAFTVLTAFLLTRRIHAFEE